MTKRGSDWRSGWFELRRDQRVRLADGVPARLGARAFDLRVALSDRRDPVVSKDDWLQLLWPGRVVEDYKLLVHVSALRRVLGRDAIITVPGRGDQFTLDAESVLAAPGVPKDRRGGCSRSAMATLDRSVRFESL